MKILFRKIGSTPLDFELKSDNITFKGFLEFYKRNLILLKADISGKLSLDCGTCNNAFDIILDENIEILLCDGEYKEDDDNLDVMELFSDEQDSTINLEDLLSSEIELYKSEYYKCSKCQQSDFTSYEV